MYNKNLIKKQLSFSRKTFTFIHTIIDSNYVLDLEPHVRSFRQAQRLLLSLLGELE